MTGITDAARILEDGSPARRAALAADPATPPEALYYLMADSAPAIRDELSALLNDLTIASTLHVVRSFSYFSHLANLAEDVHQNRQQRERRRTGATPEVGSLAAAIATVLASVRRAF